MRCMFCMGFCDDLVNFAPCGFCFHFGWPLWGDLAATCLFLAFLVPCLFGSIVPFSFGFPNIGHQSHNLYCKCVEIVSRLLLARGLLFARHHVQTSRTLSPGLISRSSGCRWCKECNSFWFCPCTSATRVRNILHLQKAFVCTAFFQIKSNAGTRQGEPTKGSAIENVSLHILTKIRKVTDVILFACRL